MDWSADTPVAASPQPYVPPAGVHVLSPHVPLPQTGTSGNKWQQQVRT